MPMTLRLPQLLWIAIVWTGPSSLRAQNVAPFAVPFQVPSVAGSARLKDSAFVGDAMAYHYQGRRITGLDVFVWPTPVSSSDSARRDSLLLLEVEKFKQTIPLGVQRGWYETYQIAFDAPHPVALASDSLRGYVVAFAFMRRREPFTSFFYIYAVHDMYLKIRLTVPGDNWNTNPALDVPAELVRAVAEPRR